MKHPRISHQEVVREANDRVILDLIRQRPGISRIEIAGDTGLAPSTVTLIADSQIKLGRLLEETATSPSFGRPRQQLRLNPNVHSVVGVEIRPRHCVVARADWLGQVQQSTTVRWRKRPEDMLARIREEIATSTSGLAKNNLLGVGFSIAGSIDKSGTVLGESLSWYEINLMSMLASLKAPTFLENNANAAAWGQFWSGAYPAQEDFLFVTTNGGIGVGVIHGGQLVRSARNTSGEFGHMVIDMDGRPCVCGNTGCWEAYASDRALEGHYRESSGKQGFLSEDIAKLAMRGEDAAVKAIEKTAEYLGVGLGNLIMGFDPAMILLDGYAAQAWPLVEAALQRTLHRRLPSFHRQGIRMLPCTEIAPDLSGAISIVLSWFFRREPLSPLVF